jgi:malonate transporter MadM subunit
MEIIEMIIGKNGLIFAFLFVVLIMLFSFWMSKKITRNKIPGVALAIIIGLGLAFFGGKKGIADIPLFAGMAVLGGAMLRDFSVVSTARGADMNKIKHA